MPLRIHPNKVQQELIKTNSEKVGFNLGFNSTRVGFNLKKREVVLIQLELDLTFIYSIN